MIDLDDDRLAEVLADVGQHLFTGPADVPARDDRRWSSVVRVALAAAAAVILLVVAIAPLRTAVADWLGIGSTRIRIDPSPTTTIEAIQSIDADLTRIDRTRAEEITGESLGGLDGSDLGAPSGFARMPEGGVLVLWPDGSTLWIHVESIDADRYFEKLVSSGAQIQRVDGLGDSAMVIEGDHLLQTPHRIVAATTAVVWRTGAMEYRLESSREPVELIEIARQLANDS
ncbi:MAG: hypothetical protein Q8M22_12855 [Actinomycetota bacterium]|nr:hypothetical protein [Actinomycetota bacterium]